MTLVSFARRASALAALLPAAACMRTAASVDALPSPTTATAPSPDPRVGLRAGWFDAGQAIWNLRQVSTTRPSAQFLNLSTPGEGRLTNSDLAFTGNLVFQGNYSGWQVWDISNPAHPTLRQAYVCPGSQSDVTVYRNLLFVSAEATNSRSDCGLQGVADTVSTERARGIRIYDISDISRPRPITIVQTCRGSHTNTLVTDPNDPNNVYIYVSGSAGVRSASELAGCSGAQMEEDPNTALFRIEVIQVPLANPAAAHIVTSPRIFSGLAAPARHGETPADSAAAAARFAASGRPPRPQGPRTGPTQCHDITVYPAIGLAGGACAGYGLLLDIRDVKNPVRIGQVADSNFSFWHSATFSNDGSKILFSDEWGGGSAPRCRDTDKMEWGSDAIFTIEDNKLKFHSYYKMPAPQTAQENCVAHNGSLIPIPGRDVMVQAWYQGGLSVFDWTDADHPKEIAFFDRGPVAADRLAQGGSWSAYWYNGLIVSSEIARGLDVYELLPSPLLSANEIAAAKTVKMTYWNTQDQQKLVWPPSFALARAYLDQLARSNGIAPDTIAAARTA
ncbi:MAG: LVIVD repeat-containing protein, partial [Gemmatimonadaceae bacterium]